MDVNYKEKTGKKGLISTTWQRCKSIGGGRKRTSSPNKRSDALKTKSRSWPRLTTMAMAGEEEHPGDRRKRRVAPEGCFSVYVGDQRERFVIKAEHANHPLFQMLLEEAESEYGYNSQGPLWLPCKVDIFRKVLFEMDDDGSEIRKGCGYPIVRHGAYHLLSPSRTIAINQF